MSYPRFVAAATAFAAVALLGVCNTAGTAHAADPGVKCEKAVSKGLNGCIKSVQKAQAKCFKTGGSACPYDDASIVKALGKSTPKIAKSCVGSAPQDAGYGASITAAALATRVERACEAETRSLHARSFGGPQEAAYGDTAEKDACLVAAFIESGKMLGSIHKGLSKCVQTQRKGKTCDQAKTNAKNAKAETKAAAKIAAVCTDVDPVAVDDQGVETVVALSQQQLIDAARAQSRCATATVHPDVTPLDLDCGPRTDIAVHTRGTFEQVILDGADWGTRCGDGSDFAFQLRLAPVGHPVENVVVAMQGGGVCLFENGDCDSVSADLLEAISDGPQTGGIMSNNDAVSPFANYTKVYLPYCTQDVFIGGGVTQTFGGGTVIERYGSVNVRKALQYVRDAIWRELDATTADGYRPDLMRVMFGGFSAGAFGTLYNYHYVLDDLQWAHTTAFPDSALALDNGTALSVANLGLLVIPQWGSRPFLPPYCFSGGCAEGPLVLATTSPRLEAVDEQRFMILSNQNDGTQVNTTFFSSTVDWVNVMRTEYCNTMGLPGVHYFLPPDPSSIHVISAGDTSYTTTSVDGELMNDWLGGIITDPTGVVDRVEEGTMTTAIPGVNAFPCTVD